MEGICFIDSNEDALAFAVLTIKGNLSVYKVKNPNDQSSLSLIDACSLSWQTSIADVLRQRNNSQSESC